MPLTTKPVEDADFVAQHDSLGGGEAETVAPKPTAIRSGHPGFLSQPVHIYRTGRQAITEFSNC